MAVIIYQLNLKVQSVLHYAIRLETLKMHYLPEIKENGECIIFHSLCVVNIKNSLRIELNLDLNHDLNLAFLYSIVHVVQHSSALLA